MLLATAALALTHCAAPATEDIRPEQVVHLSILGTNDVHGQLLPSGERGGLVSFSGYVNALRAAAISDAVLLVDAGDMWQGTLESNRNEGAAVVAAYNELGYAAAAIGNHEFDFGPVGPKPIPTDDSDNPRGALQQRAREAQFPLLAANLTDKQTGERVAWDNVASSTMVEAAGIRVGIIGLITEHALQLTIASNVGGLEVSPLAAAAHRQARALRTAGADLVIVTAHAGSECTEFDDPLDLSSCDLDGEIMQLAQQLEPGLIDHIFAGHKHRGIAHIVNGISISSSYSSTRAFGRVDFVLDSKTRAVLRRRVFAPQRLCPYQFVATGKCAFEIQAGLTRIANYEGQPVEPDPAIVAIGAAAAAEAQVAKNESLGATLAAPFTLKGNPESALGNLMTAALLEEIDGDIAIHNVSGGIRAVLPAGELTFGAVYEMFPFDNQVLVVALSGADLRRVIAKQVVRSRNRAGIAGMRVLAACDGADLQVTMALDDGHVIHDDDTIRVIANDFLALGGDGILTPVIPPQGFAMNGTAPLVRDVLVRWFRNRGALHPEDFMSGSAPHWQLADGVGRDCGLQ
jgi:5'-nucleotidase